MGISSKDTQRTLSISSTHTSASKDINFIWNGENEEINHFKALKRWNSNSRFTNVTNKKSLKECWNLLIYGTLNCSLILRKLVTFKVSLSN